MVSPPPIDWQFQLGSVYFNTAGEPDENGALYVMPEPAGWDSPAMRLSPVDVPFADGADIPDGYFGPRTIHGTGTIQAPNVTSLLAARAKLSNATRLLRTDGQFIERPADGSPQRYCTVRRLGATAFPTRYSTGEQGLEAITFDFQLVAGDPLKYDLTPRVVDVGSSTVAGGLTFPVTFPVTFAPDADVVSATKTTVNAGDVDTAILAAFNGPLSRSPQLVDRLTDRRIVLSADIPAGRTVLVDTHLQTITIDGEPVWDYLNLTRSDPLNEIVVPAFGQADWLLLGQGAGTCTVTTRDARE